LALLRRFKGASMRIVVTGAAGFIGSNIIQGLNQRGITDIIAVDDMRDGDKFRNLADLQIADYQDAGHFYTRFTQGDYGARLLYASSAATYGGSASFVERPEFEKPLNVYGYSKLLFDQRMRRECGPDFSKVAHQVCGFRYFNVYGPREQHKGRMASVAYHQHGQFQADGRVRLFGEYGGYGPGEQLRDFVWVGDVVAVNLWFFDHPTASGVFNLGTGRAQSFNEVALAVVQSLSPQKPASLAQAQAQGLIEYIPFPDALRGKYQCFTQADLSALRGAGCDHVFADVQTGVAQYMQALSAASTTA